MIKTVLTLCTVHVILKRYNEKNMEKGLVRAVVKLMNWRF